MSALKSYPKALFLILLMACTGTGLSQTNNEKLIELTKEITSVNHNINFSDKIIIISLWKSTDYESREANKEAFRVYKIYKDAKLKNGEKGVVFISFNLDEISQNKDIAVVKDGIDPETVYSGAKLFGVIKNNYGLINPKNNIVLDDNGTIQYNNIQENQIFTSIRNLITR